MKKLTAVLLSAALALGLAACGGPAEAGGESAPENTENEVNYMENAENIRLSMTIDGTPVAVEWKSNASVEALAGLAESGPVTVQMSMYGGFEQVGPLGTDLPRQDVQTVTEAGDIVLYSGDQIVVFYGSNSWAYTRLGHITDRTDGELSELLGHGDVTITISREE